MYARILGLVFLITIISFSSFADEQHGVNPIESGKDLESFDSAIDPEHSGTPYEYDEPTGSITLRQALSLAFMQNPQLKAFSWQVRVREAETLQAGLLPNPDIEGFVEDFGGTGSVEGFDGTETTVLLSQLIPLAGKVSKRKKLAALDADLAELDYETARLDVLTNTVKAFTDVLAAQRELKITEELTALAQRFYKTVSELASAGEISPIQEKRAKVAFAQTEIRLESARRELEAAKKRLAAKWGSNRPLFDEASGDLAEVLPVPEYAYLAEFIEQNPDIARWATEMERREAALKLEQSRAIPDPIVSGGYRHISEKGDNAFVVGLSIPIPIFDRNQGNVLEAQRMILKGLEEKKNAEIMVNESLASAYKSLKISYEEIQLLKSEVLHEAESAYESIFEGYREGKFSLIDVLDAQRTVFNTEFQYVQALRSYHVSLADVERLTGTPIEEIRNSDRKTDRSTLQRGPDNTGEIK